MPCLNLRQSAQSADESIFLSADFADSRRWEDLGAERIQTLVIDGEEEVHKEDVSG
jgi:hypothetical protein